MSLVPCSGHASDVDSEEQPDQVADYEGDDGYSQADAGHFKEPLFEWEILGY